MSIRSPVAPHVERCDTSSASVPSRSFQNLQLDFPQYTPTKHKRDMKLLPLSSPLIATGSKGSSSVTSDTKASASRAVFFFKHPTLPPRTSPRQFMPDPQTPSMSQSPLVGLPTRFNLSDGPSGSPSVAVDVPDSSANVTSSPQLGAQRRTLSVHVPSEPALLQQKFSRVRISPRTQQAAMIATAEVTLPPDIQARLAQHKANRQKRELDGRHSSFGLLSPLPTSPASLVPKQSDSSARSRPFISVQGVNVDDVRHDGQDRLRETDQYWEQRTRALGEKSKAEGHLSARRANTVHHTSPVLSALESPSIYSKGLTQQLNPTGNGWQSPYAVRSSPPTRSGRPDSPPSALQVGLPKSPSHLSRSALTTPASSSVGGFRKPEPMVTVPVSVNPVQRVGSSPTLVKRGSGVNYSSLFASEVPTAVSGPRAHDSAVLPTFGQFGSPKAIQKQLSSNPDDEPFLAAVQPRRTRPVSVSAFDSPRDLSGIGASLGSDLRSDASVRLIKSAAGGSRKSVRFTEDVKQ